MAAAQRPLAWTSAAHSPSRWRSRNSARPARRSSRGCPAWRAECAEPACCRGHSCRHSCPFPPSAAPPGAPPHPDRGRGGVAMRADLGRVVGNHLRQFDSETFEKILESDFSSCDKAFEGLLLPFNEQVAWCQFEGKKCRGGAGAGGGREGTPRGKSRALAAPCLHFLRPSCALVRSRSRSPAKVHILPCFAVVCADPRWRCG